MKKELYRLFVNPLIYVAFGVFFAVTIGLCIVVCFSSNVAKSENICTEGLVESYSSQSDVELLLAFAIQRKSNLDVNSLNYDTEMEKLNYQIALYEYLSNNYTPYKNLVDSSSINSDINANFFAFSAQGLKYLSLIAVILFVMFSYYIYSIDFDNGSYKYIYIRGNRTKTLRDKLLLYFLATFIITSFICLIVTAYALVLYNESSQSMVIYSSGSLNVISKLQFIFLNILSCMIFDLFFAVLMISVFMLMKKVIYAMLLVFSYYIFINIMILSESENFITSMLDLPIYNISDIKILAYGIIFQIAVPSLLFAIGMKKAIKNDL